MKLIFICFIILLITSIVYFYVKGKQKLEGFEEACGDDQKKFLEGNCLPNCKNWHTWVGSKYSLDTSVARYLGYCS